MDLSSIRAVVVDDSQLSLSIIEAMAESIGLNVKSFDHPVDALKYIEANPVDMVLTDFIMPEMNGIALVKEVRKIYEDIPIIMITVIDNDQALKNEALISGATDFLTKPFDESELRARTTNLASLRQFQNELKARDEYLQDEIGKATQGIRDRENETLQVIGRIAEMREAQSSNHTVRTGHYSKLITKGLGMDDKDQGLVFFSAQLHDVGKIGIPESILLKPAKLTTVEYEIIKNHTTIGYDILKDAESLYLKVAAIIAVSHHERFDGTGYPYGLSGKDIPVWGRIMGVADVFDVLTSRRPYKEPWSVEDSVKLILSERGTQFDPDVVDAFMSSIDEVKAVCTGLADNS
ncbi:MAG: response regulator [Nitrospirae bacterium]|nr:response regulator [Nitrospirota bacterium]